MCNSTAISGVNIKMKKVNIVQEQTFYCQKCSRYCLVIITPAVKTKNIKCPYCKADFNQLQRVKK